MQRTINPKLEEEAGKAQAHSETAEARKVMGLKAESDGVALNAATAKHLLNEYIIYILSTYPCTNENLVGQP